MWSVPPTLRGMRWSATHGSSARGPSPHNAQTVAAALTLVESRPYVPVRFAGFGWSGQRERWVGRPHTRQGRRIKAYRSDSTQKTRRRLTG